MTGIYNLMKFVVPKPTFRGYLKGLNNQRVGVLTEEMETQLICFAVGIQIFWSDKNRLMALKLIG